MSYSEVLVILEILEIIPPEENFFLVLFKLLTEAEIEGGFYWLETNGLSKKNQTQKLNRGLRWFTTRKLLPSTFPNNFWATFRKRDLDFFVFKSASESPFYQVGEQENPPGSY